MGGAFTTTHHEVTLNSLANQLFETDSGTTSKAFTAIKDSEIIGFVTINNIHPLRRSAQVGAIGLKKKYRGGRKDAFYGGSYAFEIAGVIVIYGFEILNLHKMTTHTFSDNSSVDNMYKIAGWVKEGEKRDFIPRNGKWLNRLDWSMLEQEYYDSDNFKKLKEFINWK